MHLKKTMNDTMFMRLLAYWSSLFSPIGCIQERIYLVEKHSELALLACLIRPPFSYGPDHGKLSRT